MIVVFTIFTGITTYFVYYNWSLIKNNVSCIKFGIRKETKIWQTYKWENSNKLTLKVELIIFTTTIDLKEFDARLLKVD